uniref:Putative lipocalin n=1 Tax=Ixodes ricinus TaxID=34613 RepID=A0A6B0V1H1_IXORI
MAMRLSQIIFRLWPVHIFASVCLAYSNGEKVTMGPPDAVQAVKSIPETFLHSSARKFYLECVRTTFQLDGSDSGTMELFIVQEDPMNLPPTIIKKFFKVNETNKSELLISRDKGGSVDSTLTVLYSDMTSCMITVNSIDPTPCALQVNAACFQTPSDACIKKFKKLCKVKHIQKSYTYNSENCTRKENGN